MKSRALAIATLLAAVVMWPVDRVDVSPLFQNRPERPPHPVRIYYPPGK